MTDYTKADFVLTAFTTVADMEAAASALVATGDKVNANVSRAAWGLAVVIAIQQPELSAKAIIADVALALGLAIGKQERHQPLSSRLRSALTYSRDETSPITFPKATGADNEVSVIAKAERFIGRHALTTLANTVSDIRSGRALQRNETATVEADKAERATLSLAGVTAKMSFSLTAILEGHDFTSLMASTRAGDENAIKMAEMVMRQVQAAIVAGITVQDGRKAKVKAKRPALKAA
jgi:hypothetical protein